MPPFCLAVAALEKNPAQEAVLFLVLEIIGPRAIEAKYVFCEFQLTEFDFSKFPQQEGERTADLN